MRQGKGTKGSQTGSAGRGDETDSFRSAGRALFSLGLVRGTEGNLSIFDGKRIVITRAGAPLEELGRGHLVAGLMEDALDGASSDLAVHRGFYRERGPGAVVHAHPPGSVPEGEVISGEHGVYVFAASLERALELAVRQARDKGQGREGAGG